MVVSDGAEWIRNACGEIFGGGKVTFVLDMFQHAEFPTMPGTVRNPLVPFASPPGFSATNSSANRQVSES